MIASQNPRAVPGAPPLFKLPVELIRSISDNLPLADKLSLGLACRALHQVVVISSVWSRVHLDLCKTVTKPDRGLSCYRGSESWKENRKPRIAIHTSNLHSIIRSIEQQSDNSNWQNVHTFSIHVELESNQINNRDVHTLLARLFRLLPRVMTQVCTVKFFCGGELSNSKNGTTFCGGMDATELIEMLRYYAHANWSVKVQGIACYAFRELISYNVRNLQIRSLFDESPWATLQYMFRSSTPTLPPSVEQFRLDGAFGATWKMTYDSMGKFFTYAKRLKQLHTSPPIEDLAAFEKIPSTCASLSFSYLLHKSTTSKKIVHLPQVTHLKVACDTLEFLPRLECCNLRSLTISGPKDLTLLVPFLAKNPALTSLSLSAAINANSQIPPNLLAYNDRLTHLEANQYFFEKLQPFFYSLHSVKSLVIYLSTNKDTVALNCIKYALKVFPDVSSLRVTSHTTDSWIEQTNWAKLIGVSRKGASGNLKVDLNKCHDFSTTSPSMAYRTAHII